MGKCLLQHILFACFTILPLYYNPAEGYVEPPVPRYAKLPISLCSLEELAERCSNCSIGCSTVCDDKNNTCECKDGWTGDTCSEVCETGTWGENCRRQCSDKCLDNTCNNVNGSCTCITGWKGEMCSELMSDQTQFRNVCMDGEIGTTCNNCSFGCRQPCNEDGSCRCKRGWIGKTCSEACENGRWGFSCKKTCSDHCANGTCNNVNGSCLCTAGWMGNRCSTECERGSFGMKCEETCSEACRNKNCNNIDGTCSRGCIPGRSGDFCDQPCENGKWGNSCKSQCSDNCVNRTCDNMDGSCLCTAGWMGNRCSKECERGSFGMKCEETCSEACHNKDCNNIDGTCSRGCIPGRSGDFCDQPCPEGRWGKGCEMNCSKKCINRTCDSVEGSCLCPDGLTGIDCLQKCDTGTFGRNCASVCSDGCKEERCDNVNGTCINGCIPGRAGVQCDQECNTGTYGRDCAQSCSPGCKRSTCDHVNGTCVDGCKSGKTGIHCDQDCENGTWGENCKDLCSDKCVDGMCDILNGSCACIVGWMGKSCSERCSVGTFGRDCNQKCNNNCKYSKCNVVDGTCSDGCIPGRSGEKCEDYCKEGTWGDGCTERCAATCKNDTCDYVNGSCPCKDGWTGENCSRHCKEGTWGDGCTERCAANCKNGSCDYVNGSCSCKEGWMGENCSKPKSENSTSSESSKINGSNVIGWITAAVLVAIVLVVTIGILYLMHKRKRSFSLDKVSLIAIRSTAVSTIASTASFYAETTNPVFQTDLKSELVGTANKEKVSDSRTTVAVDAFLAYLEKKKQQPQLSAYREEYNILPNGLQAPTLAATKSVNVEKNRYRNIVPYDHCRVRLNVQKGEKSSDYINASYMDGIDKKRAYVASQGPTKDITDDFWRMVWQLNSCKIIMLTNLVEGGRKKCEQYWPESGVAIYGEIAVKMISCETFSQFTIRTFHIRKNGTKSWRVIKQFHFTSWPDCKAPRCAQVMVNFRDKVIESKCTGKGPMIVHCSAGVGRTGTFIALDYLLRQAQTTGFVDVFNCVKRLRTYRPNMVQTLAQYVYLHDVLAEGLNLSSVKIIPVFKFQQVYRDLLDIDPVQKKRNIQLIFEFLQANTMYPPDTEFAAGRVNKDKNRYHNILPVDTYMPVLETRYEDRNNYINAVYFRTYNLTKGFIITQMPMEDTIIDFWRLICEQKITCIVMVNEMDESELYWPSGEKRDATYGLFRIRRVSDEILDDYIIVTLGFRYKDNDEQFLKLFRSRFWPEEQAIPESPKRMLHLVLKALKYQRETGNHPMLVHCLDGVERSGLFCVVTAVIDRLKTDQNISIPCFIRDMRSRRPQIIPNLVQFQFCYDAVSCYLKQFVDFPFYDSEMDMPV